MFEIANSVNGQITVATGKTVNYETETAYTLIILAKDRNGMSGGRTATATVLISVVAVNEADPSFATNPITNSVDENKPVGHLVTTVEATDADTGTGSNLIYSMPSHAKFVLDSVSGTISIQEMLNYEMDTSYSLTVTATDDGGKTGTTVVNINVVDVNDNSPICTQTYTASIEENILVSTTVVSIVCNDLDSGLNGVLVYTIDSMDSASGSASPVPFTISGAVLSINQPLDYETDTYYNVKIKVRDNPGSGQLSTTVMVFVTITDINEGTPTFGSSPTTASVLEDSPFGTTIVSTIAATDTDTATSIQYTFNATSTTFELDPTNCNVILKNTLSLASSPYVLTLQAVDSGSPAKTATHTLTVTVTDVNDKTPTFNPSLYWVRIAEDVVIGTTITVVTATDGDTGINSDITYSITGSVFGITTTVGDLGEITVLSMPDNAVTYDLQVTATDRGSTPKSSSVNVIVDVTKSNLDTPIFSPSSYTINIDEDQALGVRIGNTSCTDSDGVGYTIQSGGNNFKIDPDNGELFVVLALDREKNTQHVITVRCTDKHPTTNLNEDTTVTVNVGDINDNAPKFTPPVYVATVTRLILT